MKYFPGWGVRKVILEIVWSQQYYAVCYSKIPQNTKKKVQKRVNFPKKKVNFVSKPPSVAHNQSDISMYICKVF